MNHRLSPSAPPPGADRLLKACNKVARWLQDEDPATTGAQVFTSTIFHAAAVDPMLDGWLGMVADQMERDPKNPAAVAFQSPEAT